MNYLNESFEDFKNINEASVPSNIAKFAKERGILPLVKKVATWAEKAGERITGGTAIGKGYNTLIMDLTHQGAEIRIDIEDEIVTLNDVEVNDAKSFKAALNESVNEARIQYKRKYTENHPAKTMNANTKIRSKILSAIGDGVVTEDELKGILKELNANPRWLHHNAGLFKVTENGITLSRTGIRMSKYNTPKLNESLDYNDMDRILDIAAQYTSTQHEAADQSWTDAQDLYDYLKSDHIAKKHHKAFYKQIKSKFPEVNESFIKTFEEFKFVNESLSFDNSEEVVQYVIDNYKKITGDAYDFEDMPDKHLGKIERFLKKQNIDIEDFWDTWLKHNHIEESMVSEGFMSNIDIIAQESDDFESFKKEVLKEYKKQLKDSKETTEWLKEVWEESKEINK